MVVGFIWIQVFVWLRSSTVSNLGRRFLLFRGDWSHRSRWELPGRGIDGYRQHPVSWKYPVWKGVESTPGDLDGTMIFSGLTVMGVSWAKRKLTFYNRHSVLPMAWKVGVSELPFSVGHTQRRLNVQIIIIRTRSPRKMAQFLQPAWMTCLRT